MKKDLATVSVHGFLAKEIQKSQWRLKVKTIAEAFRAINVLTKHKFSKVIEAHNPRVQRYKVVVNGKTVPNDLLHLEDGKGEMRESNFNINQKIKTIDVIPVIEGAGFADIIMTVVGVILIIVGILVTIGTFGGGAPLGYTLITIGVGLLAAGLSNLLSKPPSVGDIEEISRSYLFAGPTNVIGEGRPVPLGYGTLRVGSQRVAASYAVSYEYENTVADNVVITTIC
jgi:predicted phage tail protein